LLNCYFLSSIVVVIILNVIDLQKINPLDYPRAWCLCTAGRSQHNKKYEQSLNPSLNPFHCPSPQSKNWYERKQLPYREFRRESIIKAVLYHRANGFVCPVPGASFEMLACAWSLFLYHGVEFDFGMHKKRYNRRFRQYSIPSDEVDNNR